MKRQVCAAVSAFAALFSLAVASADSQYLANEQSLAEHTAAPEWFRDAKFGIYFHWGPYTVPAYGNEWYPRWMFFEDMVLKKNGVSYDYFSHHRETWGDATEFGYHDFVPMFTAEKFNPEEWAELFEASGARFAGPVAEHHDGFAMWDSDATPWNAADMGPRRDITGELSAALRQRGLKLITTFHHARHLQRYVGDTDEMSRTYAHPRHRYRDSHYPWVAGYPTTSDDDKLRYLYGNIPEDEWLKDVWLKKLKEVIDQYEPDIIWFDSWLDRIPMEYRLEFAAYYLNHARELDKDVVITRKQEDLPLSFSIDDYEKGRMDRLTEEPWLTDDTISLGSWSYTRDLTIKSSRRVLHDFIDIVSKNGQLLLNISPRADGSIPDDQRDVLLDLGAWLERNGEAIYDTRPWRVFGEGPTRLSRGGGFVKAVEYTPADIRFTMRGDDVLYVISLGRPQGRLTVQSLGTNLSLYEGEIDAISLIGSGETVAWERDASGLHIVLPQTAPEQLAYVWRVVKTAGEE